MVTEDTFAEAPQGNGHSILLGDDPHIVLKGDHGRPPKIVFLTTLAMSMSRGGQPVRCTNFVRGVSLLLDSDIQDIPATQIDAVLDFIATTVEPPLKNWLRHPPSGVPLVFELLGVTARFAHNSHLEWLPGVMQLDVEQPATIEAFTTSPARTPKADRSHTLVASQPAIPPPTHAAHQHKDQKPVVPYRLPGDAVSNVLESIVDAMGPEYSMLPFPVRFRASGSPRAWAEACHAAGASGAALERAFADPHVGPFQLLHDVGALIVRDTDGRVDPEVAKLTNTNIILGVPPQAFWSRKGVLFEPTVAFEQLLKLSDIDDGVPLAAAAGGASALCIVPGPSLRDAPHRVDSITIFEHMHVCAEGTSERSLTFFVPRRKPNPNDYVSIRMQRLRIDDDSLSIREAIEECLSASDAATQADFVDDEYEFWLHVLSYSVKVLIYLASDHPQIRQDNAYTNAPRNFAGLGKRKKHERRREIERLYDRYIVGPEVLPRIQTHPRKAGPGEGAEISPHWRRGHFRLQRHGTGFAKSKVVFIMPVIVRADRM
ncbi:hypothetical protein C7401_14349 [Paraburkholderia unamae]|uniref:hypothetical protein n=1 Tax=Paraburkholderia unamae TaxID=219649 RepID=UPI000DC342EF|nr:hypothetical protein [Paraburkholderia unamae]RAR50057.1 hypothetical protein C7401_14349 [Paraburkholderia unamae]